MIHNTLSRPKIAYQQGVSQNSRTGENLKNKSSARCVRIYALSNQLITKEAEFALKMTNTYIKSKKIRSTQTYNFILQLFQTNTRIFSVNDIYAMNIKESVIPQRNL